MQTLRIGRFGSGYVLVMGTSSAFIGVCIGIVFFALAFLPKVMAVLIAIPSPVAAAYLTVLAVTQRFSPCAGERKEVFGEGDCCLRILYVSSTYPRPAAGRPCRQ